MEDKNKKVEPTKTTTPPIPTPSTSTSPEEKAKTEVQELMEIVKKQAADIQLLKTISDKKALAQYYQRNQGKIPLHMKLRVLDGKVIVGWRTTKDISEYDNELRRFITDQKVEVVFEDATKKEMSQLDFNRHFTYVECEQIGKEEKDDVLIIELKRLDNEKVYKVDITFVN